MKAIHHANEELLHLLFDWKRKEGQFVRFSIEQEEGKWVLTFFSVDHLDSDKHVFASFSGKSHDELKKWALDRLVSYQISELVGS
ncbi:hypothetical protein [Ammoniphilus sp. CFH 90114]|uniref:hypothetical protein n=1 Tax=Ammoniphilus sp. CFH 90114 TaxID=2493665 RepID=UPI00100E5AB7|nr:hypothetical protein [Ammoniphilus sp. CFH 90114]RXT14644.1 hypothetical protein EIZ39_00030 [Ammoniphilus sp. CFH 90114]